MTTCQPTCANPTGVPNCTLPSPCLAGCKCKAGYLLEANGLCVPEAQCGRRDNLNNYRNVCCMTHVFSNVQSILHAQRMLSKNSAKPATGVHCRLFRSEKFGHSTTAGKYADWKTGSKYVKTIRRVATPMLTAHRWPCHLTAAESVTATRDSPEMALCAFKSTTVAMSLVKMVGPASMVTALCAFANLGTAGSFVK